MCCLVLFAAMTASAQTIITRTGTPAAFGLVGPADYVSWTQTGTFSNVTIAANLISSSGTASGNAYLTTQVGAGTTTAQQVATTAVSTSNSATSGIPTTLFSGLTLGPGTYYVVVSGANLGLGTGSSAVTVVGTGVTANGDGVASSLASFPPASTFFLKGQTALFSAVAGSSAPPTGVPALSPFAMLATALLILASGLALLKVYRPQQ